MKKLITFIVVVAILAVGYLLIRPSIPEWTVNFALGQIQDGHYETIIQHADLGPTEADLLRHVVRTAEYEVKGSRILGNQAFVTVDLTFMDLQQLVIENHQQLLNNVLGNLGGILGGLLGGNLAETAMEQLNLLLEEENLVVPLKTREVEVVLDQQFLWFVPNMEQTQDRLEAVFREELTINFTELLLLNQN